MERHDCLKDNVIDSCCACYILCRWIDILCCLHIMMICTSSILNRWIVILCCHHVMMSWACSILCRWVFLLCCHHVMMSCACSILCPWVVRLCCVHIMMSYACSILCRWIVILYHIMMCWVHFTLCCWETMLYWMLENDLTSEPNHFDNVQFSSQITSHSPSVARPISNNTPDWVMRSWGCTSPGSLLSWFIYILC